MKNLAVLVAVLAVVFSLGITQEVEAQNYHSDGGLLVVEDVLLSGETHKQIVFVVSKNISSAARVEMQTHTSEGVVNQFKTLVFPQGLTRGQIVPIWNGDLNSFGSTPWLNIWVTISTATDIYYTHAMFPIQSREQYKEPMITSIGEVGGYGTPYQITAKGIFDTTISSLVLINKDVFVSPKAVIQTAPGTIQFTMPSGNFEQFPSGKYLLTICQGGHCDTLRGRHR